MRCPVDNHLMRSELRHGITIDRCPTCQGVWLDVGELQKLVQFFSQDETNTFLRLAERDQLVTTSPREFWNETDRLCPHDSTTLNRRYFAGNSGVGIEHCPKCLGFWFDGGELASVRKVVAPNPRLDAAVADFGFHAQDELENRYDDLEIAIMDRLAHPEILIDDAANFGLQLLFNYVARLGIR